MGILDKYNSQKDNVYSQTLAYFPQKDPVKGLSEVDQMLEDSKLSETLNKTSLDLENSSPLGGPINEPYTTRVGGINNGEVKTFSTTQPYTPKNTYLDSLQDKELIDRARDPFK